MFEIPEYLPDWGYELIILFILTLTFGVVSFLIWLMTKRKKDFCRYPILYSLILILAGITFAVVFYGSFIAPRQLVVNYQSIDIPRIQFSEPLRIAVISDTHFGPYKKTSFIKKVVAQVIDLHPDLILLGGDAISENPEEMRYGAPLKDLGDTHLVYAALGNHDSGLFSSREYFIFEPKKRAAMLDWYAKYNIKTLLNEAAYISVKGKNFWLAGVEDFDAKRNDEALAKSKIKTNDLTILLTHNPDVIFGAQKAGFDLVVAGHTHGGQVRLPVFGPMGQIPTELGQAFDKGQFNFGQTKLFITSGVGESGTRARLFNPPEIVILRVF